MNKVVNNWKCAEHLTKFKISHIEPLEVEVDKAFKIITDLNYKWSSDEQRVFANKKFNKMNETLRDFKNLFDNVNELILQHEDLVNQMVKWYDLWRNNIALDGKQPRELMSLQAKILNDIFTEIYTCIEPLGLEIKKPE